MSENKNPNAPQQETHSVENSRNIIQVKDSMEYYNRSLTGQILSHELNERIIEELQNICGAMNRIAEATEEGNRYLRNISDTCDDCKGDTIDKLDFRSEIRKEVHGIYGNTSVIQAEVSRIKSGIKEGKFKV